MSCFHFFPRGPTPLYGRPSYPPERLEPRVLLSTFAVTTEADSGPGSLRQAILAANAFAGLDIIRFAIPGAAGAVHTIRPLSALPTITDALEVDGTTQPHFAALPLLCAGTRIPECVL